MSFLIRITGPLETDENRPTSPGSAALEEMKMEEVCSSRKMNFYREE